MAAQAVTLRGGGPFWKDLNAEVRLFLATPGVRERGYRRLHKKAAIIGVWALASYVPLVLIHTWWLALPFGFSLVWALAAVELNIMHDGNHGAFSRSRRVNRLAGYTLELMAGSSLTWKVKHNQAHHAYPNVDGIDEDIDQPPFARLASTQEWKPWHRYQHVYLWFVYGLVLVRWQTYGDTLTMIKGRISHYDIRNRTTPFEIAMFALGKLIFIGWAFILPIMLGEHRWWVVLCAYGCIVYPLSVIMIVTFQLAHCNDEAEFRSADEADKDGKLPGFVADNQILTTAGFCHGNQALTWWSGGLNYQPDHHEYPAESHTLLPDINKIVRRACAQHGLTYLYFPTLWSALTQFIKYLTS